MRDPRAKIVAGGALVQFTVIGFLFAFALFFKEIEAELGWSRALISLGASLATLAMGSFAILAGRFNDQLGPRVVLTASGIVFVAGILTMSAMSAPWHYLLTYGLLVGIGLATHDVVTLSTVARWYDKRRGLMTAVVKTGTAAGQVVLPLVAALLIGALGWRGGLFAIGLGSLGLLLVAAAMMRLPTEAERPAPSPTNTGGVGFQEARRTRAFWTLCAIQFLFFPTMMTVPFHLAAHGQDLGLSVQASAQLLSILGGVSVLGRLVIGGVADRVGAKGAYALALSGLCVSLSLYAVTTAAEPLFAITALYGFCHGAMFVVVSPSVARLFGMRAHGQIFGVILFFGTLGGAIGPTLAGWIFDQQGSYTPAFLTLGAAAALAVLLALSLPRPSAEEARSAA